MIGGCSGAGKTGAPAETTAAGTESTSSAAGATTAAETKAENKKIDKLNVYFVPSREPQEIVTATEPLKGLLKTETGQRGL